MTYLNIFTTTIGFLDVRTISIRHHVLSIRQNHLRFLRLILRKYTICVLLLQVLLPPKGNLLDVLGEKNEFSQLVAFIKVIGLAEELQHLQGATFYAPTNTVSLTL